MLLHNQDRGKCLSPLDALPDPSPAVACSPIARSLGRVARTSLRAMVYPGPAPARERKYGTDPRGAASIASASPPRGGVEAYLCSRRHTRWIRAFSETSCQISHPGKFCILVYTLPQKKVQIFSCRRFVHYTKLRIFFNCSWQATPNHKPPGMSSLTFLPGGQYCAAGGDALLGAEVVHM